MPQVDTTVPGGAGTSTTGGGSAEQFQSLQHAMRSVGAPPSGAGGGPGQAPPSPGGPQQPGPASPPPQPLPGVPYQDNGIERTPNGHLDMSKVFSNLTTIPSWRQNAATWAAHPQAGTYIKLLGKLSKSDLNHGNKS